MRPPLFVPGTREVEDVLADMKRLKTHLAVVLDEYGGTAGLVTMEDLLEEIVGPIFDEYDPRERPPPAGRPLLDGAMPIREFNSEYDEALSDEDYTTIGGWIFGQLGRLPRTGDRVTAGHPMPRSGRDGRAEGGMSPCIRTSPPPSSRPSPRSPAGRPGLLGARR